MKTEEEFKIEKKRPRTYIFHGAATYCYSCGKKLVEGDELRGGFQHIKCFGRRKAAIYASRKERYRKLMSDPIIRKRISEIDAEILLNNPKTI